MFTKTHIFILIIFGFNMKGWQRRQQTEKSSFLKITNKHKSLITPSEQKIFTTFHVSKNFQKDFSWLATKDIWQCGFEVKKTIRAQTKRTKSLISFDVGESLSLNLLQLSLLTSIQVRST